MKLRDLLSPWRKANRLQYELDIAKLDLAAANRVNGNLKSQLTRCENDYQEMVKTKDEQLRRLGLILAMRAGISVLFMLCLNLMAQPLLRNPLDTNNLALAPADGWIVGMSNGVPVWLINLGAGTNVQITALLPNGTGALTNNGAGTIGYYNFFASLVSPNVFSASNNFTAQLTPSGGMTSTNANFSPVMLWSNTKNTDGNLWMVLNKPPFYQVAINILTNLGVADNDVFGDSVASGDDGTGTGVPVIKMGDNVVIGNHCANWITNMNSSVLIGYGAGQGQQSVVGIAPYNILSSAIIAGNVAAIFQASNIVNCFFMGAGSGTALGSGGGVTNCTVIGVNAASLVGSVNNTNDTVIGSNSELPTGGSGEMSIDNLIYAQGMDAHGGGNVGIGAKLPVSKLDVSGIINSSSRIIATNGIATFPTNIISSLSSSGFTNDVAHSWGTNTMIVDIIAVGETVAFYNRSGALGQISCGTLLFTDTGIANKEYTVGVNCGVAFSVGTFTSGTARGF